MKNFYSHFSIWSACRFDMNNGLLEPDRLSGWGPFAKGFGAMLDLNCSFVLLPVLRTILRGYVPGPSV